MAETRVINTWRDPYDEGYSICRFKQIEFKEGLTVLVGCNGIGKSTTLHNLKDELRNEDIPFLWYDNLKDGGSYARQEAGFYGDFAFISNSLCSSEGENINLNICKITEKLHYFIVNGVDPINKYLEEKDNVKSNERWLLFDAIDSGYSIDNVLELKGLLDLVKEDAKNLNLNLYIIVSANEYELANGEQCMDVTTGKYIQFSDYEDYKKFILENKKKKDKRYKNKI